MWVQRSTLDTIPSLPSLERNIQWCFKPNVGCNRQKVAKKIHHLVVGDDRGVQGRLEAEVSTQKTSKRRGVANREDALRDHDTVRTEASSVRGTQAQQVQRASSHCCSVVGKHDVVAWVGVDREL